MYILYHVTMPFNHVSRICVSAMYVFFFLEFHTQSLCTEKFVGGALFLSLCPPCGELLKNLDLTPEGETLLLKTAKEVCTRPVIN